MGLFAGGSSSSLSAQNTVTTQQQVTQQGGGAGSVTVATGSGGQTQLSIQSLDPQVAQAAFDFANKNADSFLKFGAETVGNVETASAESSAYQQQTIASLSDKLAQIVANAAPQSDAAVQERLAGGSPTLSAPAISSKIVELAAIVSIVGTVWLLIRNK
jgi:cobalamin biosynthesis Mg chelatase CobN